MLVVVHVCVFHSRLSQYYKKIDCGLNKAQPYKHRLECKYLIIHHKPILFIYHQLKFELDLRREGKDGIFTFLTSDLQKSKTQKQDRLHG